MDRIMANRLDRGYFEYQKEFDDKALEVLRSGWYVLGKEVDNFENEFASYLGSKYCRGVASGLDALWIAFRILGIGKGDEVIVPANTYIASVMGITMNDAVPVFVEPNEFYNIDEDRIEEIITNRTKAILVVHLYGQAANMEKICQIAKKYNLRIVEDCAQSHGASFKNKKTGTYGDIGCFSFYPSKNLGAFGDAGAIVTDNEELAREVEIIRNYGSERRYYNKVIGANSRLDEIQAGLLRVRLLHLNDLNEERKKICTKYLENLNSQTFILPQIEEGATHVWHQFVIRCEQRNKLITYLESKKIGTIIHYPIPPHLSEAYSYLGYKKGSFPQTELFAQQVLSIPLYSGMRDDEQNYVIECMNNFEC